jgi:hypothetical protein
MGKYIIPQEKIQKKLHDIRGIACDGYLAYKDGETFKLLAISLVGEKSEASKALGMMTYIGPVLNGIEVEKLPASKSADWSRSSDAKPLGWKVDLQHVTAYKALVVLGKDTKSYEIKETVAPAQVLDFVGYRQMTISADSEEARNAAIRRIKDRFSDPESVVTSIVGSKYNRLVAVGPEVQGKTADGASTDKIFLIGADRVSAKEQFFAQLVEATIPVLPEWQDLLWDKFEREGWIATLYGHRMAGYVVTIDRDGILNLIGKMIEDRVLPRPVGVPIELW